MGFMDSFIAGGLVLFGALFLCGGFFLSSAPVMQVGVSDSVTLGAQLQDIGFIIVVAGFIAWGVVFLFRKIGLIKK